MKVINSSRLADLVAKAGTEPRKRAHLNLHDDLSEPIHRLCIAVEPGSYVRPHRHLSPPKKETLVILEGRLAILTFDVNGTVTDRIELNASGPDRIIEIEAGTWHAFSSLCTGTLVMEIKAGPYVKPIPDDFAVWAPEEGAPLASEFEKWYAAAGAGSKWQGPA